MKNVYLELFWVFYRPFQRRQVAPPSPDTAADRRRQRMDDDGGGNLITIEMTPMIAVNSSTFVASGGRNAGGIVATIGCVLPSCIIVSLLAFLYTKYKNLNAVQTVLAVLRPTVIGIIALQGASILTLSIWGKNVNLTDADLFSAGIFILSSLAMIKFKKFSPMLVMLISGAAGILVYVLS